MTHFVFPASAFVPLAIGFFGLATGYFIWGGQALFGYPKATSDVNRAMGLWGLWMPGFLQFITGVYIIVGLTWFNVFGSAPPLYMAGLAFTAYGVHWFALGLNKYTDSSARTNAWMAIVFFLLSVLGVLIFFGAGDVPVAILFIGISLGYLTEIPTQFGVFPGGVRLGGLWQLLTGIWLIYLAYAITFNLALGAHWWV